MTVSNRYQIIEQIGEGGMGTVYRALDQLAGHVVALKRVTAPVEHLQHTTSGAHTDFRRALALEFRTLASLRHPNIISVLDYGFDDERRPFFTMQLLDHAENLLDAAEKLPFETKIELLVQVLQSLTYLHRRGIIHRDLKPDNVLVVDSHHVRVLDFGLAAAREHLKDHDEAVGTIAYMSPEVLQGKSASEASDLYAVGVMAYQILTGKHPYSFNTITELIQNILIGIPDYDTLDVDIHLRRIIERLLEKSPAKRYNDAVEVIQDLSSVTGCFIEYETATIRESFLQSAQFVGRQLEYDQLTTAMKQTLQSEGSVWLVGGESGVGKSRLLDELRIQALVDGMMVLRGQSVTGGGGKYQVWRDIIYGMAMSVDLTDYDFAVLMTIEPDMENYADHPIAPIPQLDPQQTQKRFFDLVADFIHRLNRPIMIILEDLQWSGSESLLLLNHLNRTTVCHHPLFIVGNYRNDERPDLPAELPQVNILKLERLHGHDIADLSAAILGEHIGRQEKVVELLERETEGNVFFVVEVVRALAEEAGQLDRIGQMSLPRTVFAEGVKTVVQRRLSHIPEPYYPLLKLAAVAGRYLNLELLQKLQPNINITEWLNAGANVAVLEVQDERWRFAHDKLRERILEDLTDEERPSFHRCVAEAIEELYPDDNKYYPALDHLWSVAGDLYKETFYATESGNLALQISANAEAIRYFERALKQLDSLADFPGKQYRKMDTIIALSVALTASRGYSAPEVEKAYRDAFDLSMEVGEMNYIFRALFGLANVHSSRANLKEADELADNMLQMAEYMPEEFALMAHSIKGSITVRRGNLQEGQKHSLYVAEHYDPKQHRALGIQYGQDPGLSAWTFGALNLAQMGYLEQSAQWFERSAMIADELDYPFSRLFATYYGGVLRSQALQKWDDLEKYAQETISIADKYDYPFYRAMGMISCGWGMAQQGRAEESLKMMNAGLDRWEALGAPRNDPNWSILLADVYRLAGDFDAALEIVNRTILLSKSTNENIGRANGAIIKAEILLAQGKSPEEPLLDAIDYVRSKGGKLIELRATYMLACYRESTGRSQEAYEQLAAIYNWFTEGFHLPDLVNARALLDHLEKALT